METAPAAPRSGRDRLSDLPDCLLHSVLSSLRSRQVVQTCLLSRRWRHLWRSVPCLDVDQREFLLDEAKPEAPGGGASDEDRQVYNKALKERLDRQIKRQRSFEDFADAMLLFHGVDPLDACGLHIADRDLRTGLHRWIRRGLARHPAELRLTYDFRTYKADDLVFSFELASGGASVLSVTSRLRRLHLSRLTLSEKFAEELRSECPVLEELKLVSCQYDYKFGGRIASRSLKRLHIEGCCSSHRTFRSFDDLDAHALVSLNLTDNEDELPSLAMASIREPNKYSGEYCFLKSLSNARVLELQSFTTNRLLTKETEEFRKFHNLETLILMDCDIGDSCEVLRYVLENVRNLERLVLQDCKISGYFGSSKWSGTAFHGCKNLKSIRVKYDHGVPSELVDELTQIAKDFVKTHLGSTHYVGWLDWMRRVVGWKWKFIRRRRYPPAAAYAVTDSDNSLSDHSDEEVHQSRVWKHRAGKKHDADEGDCVVKASRRTAHLARR